MLWQPSVSWGQTGHRCCADFQATHWSCDSDIISIFSCLDVFFFFHVSLWSWCLFLFVSITKSLQTPLALRESIQSRPVHFPLLIVNIVLVKWRIITASSLWVTSQRKEENGLVVLVVVYKIVHCSKVMNVLLAFWSVNHRFSFFFSCFLFLRTARKKEAWKNRMFLWKQFKVALETSHVNVHRL